MSEDYRMKKEIASSTKITENEGWNAMRDLLDQTMPVEPKPRALLRWSPTVKMFTAAAIISVTAVIITGVMLYNHNESAGKQAIVHHRTTQRKQIADIRTASVLPTDSTSGNVPDNSLSQSNPGNTRNPEPDYVSTNKHDFTANEGGQHSPKIPSRNNRENMPSEKNTTLAERATEENNPVITTGATHSKEVPETSPKPDNAYVPNQTKTEEVQAVDAAKNAVDTLPKAISESLQTANESNGRDALSVKKINGRWRFFEKTHFGLGWYFHVPLNGTEDYFTDTDNKNRPYLSLIPSLWVSRSLSEKLSINVEFRPYALHGGKQSAINGSAKDSTSVSMTEYNRLVKSSGFDFRSGFEYRLKGNWKVGMGVEWTKTSRILMEKKTFDNKGNSLTDEYVSAGKSDSVFSAIRSSGFALNVSGGYSFKWFDTGLTVRLPVVPLSAQQQLRNEPFSVDLYVRWKIK